MALLFVNFPGRLPLPANTSIKKSPRSGFRGDCQCRQWMQGVLGNVRIFSAGRQLATASTNFSAVQENETEPRVRQPY